MSSIAVVEEIVAWQPRERERAKWLVVGIEVTLIPLRRDRLDLSCLGLIEGVRGICFGCIGSSGVRHEFTSLCWFGWFRVNPKPKDHDRCKSLLMRTSTWNFFYGDYDNLNCDGNECLLFGYLFL
jgi:hypothetical protein